MSNGKVYSGWQTDRYGARRRCIDRLVTGLSLIAASCLVLVLASILWTLLSKGLSGLTFAAVSKSMGPPGSGGGFANAIIGSVIQTALALVMATPLGMGCGIYLSEYGSKRNHFALIVRFVSDVLMSVPSILVGLFVYEVWVAPVGHFSAFSGSVALAILAVPIIVRTTEDMLRLVPLALREAGAALGAARWKVTLSICLRSAKAGIVTGVLLALARVSGETAPLLFTSLGNQNWSLNLNKPMASLPMTIYQYAGASYEDWVQLAWAAALFVTLGVLTINIVVRFSARRG
ncbi:phosphate ABC transporter permease PstA [Swingsia samuiensis]|uniref:Phosphate transport system permease protein PstA n=1 Tax=Swingsia samuiensis TaxID=1293412 RepID=A0A4Y6UJ83_9PROT|nr:phosphate ABC transporter permease PstA [Swingsia samuiensis]QDH17124.1 phosphate ABC transporter permease PstA [Swingsia samuiensis]